MTFLAGFMVWIVLGLIGAFVAQLTYRGPGTIGWLNYVFGFFGAFIGGMLGTSPYIFHDPTPMRVGALIGALAGAFVFTFMYHFIARKAV
jgi:uncharacterized membrane protein YeaQ/YmgE (transglycosylase-associated protein family)